MKKIYSNLNNIAPFGLFILWTGLITIYISWLIFKPHVDNWSIQIIWLLLLTALDMIWAWFSISIQSYLYWLYFKHTWNESRRFLQYFREEDNYNIPKKLHIFKTIKKGV